MPQQKQHNLFKILFYCAILFIALPLISSVVTPLILIPSNVSLAKLPLILALTLSTSAVGFLLTSVPVLMLTRHQRLLITYVFLLFPISMTGLITQVIMFKEFGTEINQRVFEMFEGNLASVWTFGCHYYHIHWIILSAFLVSAFFTWVIFRPTDSLPQWIPSAPSIRFYLWLAPIFLVCGVISVALRTNIEQVPGYTPEKLSRSPIYQMLWLAYDKLTDKDTGYRNILEKVKPVNQSNYAEICDRLGEPPESFIQQKTLTPTWLKKHPSHVFLFLLESFGNDLITKRDLQPLAPNLNQLAREGLYTEHFWASGYFTMHAIHSVIPGIGHTSFSESPETLHIFKLDTLPRLMKRAGYQPLFYCASHGNIASKKDLCLGYGYQKFLSCPEEAPNLPSNEWGVCDGDFFTWAQKELSSLKSPHFITFLNVSNHAPYDAPIEAVSFSEETLSYFGIPDAKEKLKFARHIHYADAQMDRMVRYLIKLYPDALFVFTGDHGNSKIKDSKSGQVPFILWNPNILDHKVSTKPWRGSQMDILASLANLTLKNNASFTTLGRPVWSDDPSRVSVTYNTIVTHEGARDLKGDLFQRFQNKSSPIPPSKEPSDPFGYAKKASAIEALSWGFLNSRYLEK